MSISTSIAAWGIDTTSNEVAKEQIMSKKEYFIQKALQHLFL